MIILAWPDKVLNPNWKGHWAIKSKATKAAREAAGWATISSGDKVYGNGSIYLHVYFYPPDKRRRDSTNMVASLKAAFDGIADGLGVNDIRFHVSYEVCQPIKDGKVKIFVMCRKWNQ